jgi:hypothetical protein
MKTLFTIVFLALTVYGKAQSCLGNGTFATAALFDPAWVYGCATGTSCSGGTTFSTLTICEPVTAMDACAPAPVACGTGTNGSDIWFSFYATGTTATISVIQNTSFVAAIQAFGPGSDCATLVQIGCAVAGGPSGGVQLGLTGLMPGGLYHYRVYGSASNASQRTGNFCFCGSTGMSNVPLPVAMQLSASAQRSSAALTWTAVDEATVAHYEVQRSDDAITFAPIGTVPVQGQATAAHYVYTDSAPTAPIHYYRIQAIDQNGSTENSNIAQVNLGPVSTFTIAPNPCVDVLQFHTTEAFSAEVVSMSGSSMLRMQAEAGANSFALPQLAEGVYFLRDMQHGTVKKFVVLH